MRPCAPAQARQPIRAPGTHRARRQHGVTTHNPFLSSCLSALLLFLSLLRAAFFDPALGRLYSAAYTGGSIAAAQSVWSGESEVAICLMGGQTHARRDCASGFSYVNDVVLAILQLLRPDPALSLIHI